MITTTKKQKTQLTNQLEKLLYGSMPELLVVSKQRVSMWLLRLLKKYPTLSKLKNAKMSGLIAIKGITKEKAEKVKAKIKQSIGYPGDECSAYVMKKTAEQIIAFANQIKETKGHANINIPI